MAIIFAKNVQWEVLPELVMLNSCVKNVVVTHFLPPLVLIDVPIAPVTCSVVWVNLGASCAQQGN